MSVSNKVYNLLPHPLQSLACSVYGLKEKRVRTGKVFWEYFNWLQESQYFGKDLIREYQDHKVQEIVKHCYESVPFYRERLTRAGVVPSDIRSVQDLSYIPILTKDDVRSNFEGLQSSVTNDIPKRKGKTSGSTGSALRFVESLEATAFRWAVWWRHRARFGFLPGMWHVNFTGKPVVPISVQSPPFWRVDFFRRQIIVSSQHLVPSKIGAIVEMINRKNIRFFTGYPSLMHQFCLCIEDFGANFSVSAPVFFCGAEKVFANQKLSIEKCTGGIVTDQYGFGEGACNASKCEWGNYHIDWEYGVFEVIDRDRDCRKSLAGKVVGTGFSDLAMPFLRYEVGDIATPASANFRCECGRDSPVVFDIEGRVEDYVLTPEGGRVMRFDYLFKDTPGIFEAQVVQIERAFVIIRYTANQRLSEEKEQQIRSLAKEWISPTLKLRFKKVDEIERLPSGKFHAVVSRLGEASDDGVDSG